MRDSYIFQSPVGALRIREENGRLTELSLTDEEPGAGLLKGVGHSDLLYEAYTQIQEYFAGKRRIFSLPVDPAGTAFQKRVWRQLVRIPYGETRSYGDIAAGIGSPKAVRAVGGANHNNPIIIVIPCHRVIYKSGALGGFGCGLDVKQYLLDLEKGNR